MASRFASNAREAGQIVYSRYGEVPIKVETASWGNDFLVSARGPDGKTSCRVIEHENQIGQGRDSAMGSQLYMRHSMIEDLRRPTYAEPIYAGNVRLTDSVSGRKPPTPIEEQSETELLAAMDQLSARILPLDSGLALEIGDLHSRIQECLKQRVRERRAEARGEFDALTQQGRQALQELRKLEAERDGIREDMNRVIFRLNGAKKRLQVVKAQRPVEDDFPSQEDVAGWQEKFDAAKAEADELQRQVSEMQDDYRRASAPVAIAKRSVAEIRQKRDAARRRAGIKAASEQPDEMEESLRAV